MISNGSAPRNYVRNGAKSIHKANNQGLAEQNHEVALNAKSRRFELLRHAQGLLYDPEKAASQQERACWCHRAIRSTADSIAVYRQDSGAGSRLAGVTTCGSVWACPVCASKITEHRRKELEGQFHAWLAGGGQVMFLTLTFPHVLGQPLAWLMPRFAKALQRFKNSRAYKGIMKSADHAGSIRSLETTCGNNGWHPHVHELVFLSRNLTLTERDTLSDAWFKALKGKGVELAVDSQLSAVLSHGLHLQDGRYALEYALKFGIEGADLPAEMTKPHSKIGRVGEFEGEWHYSPFQLLAWAEKGDGEMADLFKEFVAGFKGKRMLSYSPGLRDTLKHMAEKYRDQMREDHVDALTGEELDDDQIAALDDPMPNESKVGAITGDQLAVLISRNKLGEFHSYVARCCSDLDSAQQDMDDYIRSVAQIKRSRSGRYLKKPFIGRGPMMELDAIN